MSLDLGRPGRPDAVAATDVVLAARGITAGYGPQAVIHDIDLEVRPGEIVALLGANGAGKTTTLLTLAGEIPPLDGEVELDGTVTKAPLHRRAKHGLMFVTEERSVFMGLSTRDNLRVGHVDVDEVLGLFPELASRLDVRGGLLSGGEQQMLTLGRALARHPRVLLADELSMGLAPLVVERLLGAVRQAADERGTAVLLVEQHVRKALRYADRAYVMRRGRIELGGTASELARRIDEIESHYLSVAAT
ncbi:MAG: ABC transporter ATP-binding protein [Actinomycetota bacterium]|nr:ABC transporter ATP-binding protein [Actinomycetota bacterium]